VVSGGGVPFEKLCGLARGLLDLVQNGQSNRDLHRPTERGAQHYGRFPTPQRHKGTYHKRGGGRVVQPHGQERRHRHESCEHL